MPNLLLDSIPRDEVSKRSISGSGTAPDIGKTRTLPGRSQLTIRLAKLDQAQAIVDLTATIFGGKDHFSRASLANKSDVERLMRRGKFLLAENGKGIIGYAYLEPSMEASRLELLAVTPSHQRTGIGSQLLEAAERLSCSMRCLFMHVHVKNLNWETLKFCRRRGYVEFGIEPLYGQQSLSPYCHIVRLCKKLGKDRPGF